MRYRVPDVASNAEAVRGLPWLVVAGLVRLGRHWSGLAWRGRFGRRGQAGRGRVRHDMAGEVGSGLDWCVPARHGRLAPVWLGGPRCGAVWQGRRGQA